MKRFVLLVATVIVLGAPAWAGSQASREEVLRYLREAGIVVGTTRVEELAWDEKAHRWFVSLRDASGKTSKWRIEVWGGDYRAFSAHKI
jgi:hypothetical protein